MATGTFASGASSGESDALVEHSFSFQTIGASGWRNDSSGLHESSFNVADVRVDSLEYDCGGFVVLFAQGYLPD
jgi:hypothetical protein